MNYYTIKSKEDPQYGNCLYFAKLYEKEFFNQGRNKYSRIILDDCNSKVIIRDEIEYKLPNELYLQLYDDLVKYRKQEL